MLTYTALQDRPREFLAATGLTHAEFARLLPAFATAYALLYPPEQTWEGQPRQRRAGGGATGTLPQMEDKASIMAPATPFYFWTTQKHPTVERTMRSMT